MAGPVGARKGLACGQNLMASAARVKLKDFCPLAAVEDERPWAEARASPEAVVALEVGATAPAAAGMRHGTTTRRTRDHEAAAVSLQGCVSDAALVL